MTAKGATPRELSQPWCAWACLVFVVLGSFASQSWVLAWPYIAAGTLVLPAIWGRAAATRVSAASGGLAISTVVLIQAAPAAAVSRYFLATVALSTLIALGGRFWGEHVSRLSLPSHSEPELS